MAGGSATVSPGDETATFSGTIDILQLEDPADFSGDITNFQQGDTIDLLGISATETTLNATGTLTVQETGGGSFDLNVPGVTGGQGLIVTPDGNGGSDLSLTTAPAANATTYVFTGDPFNEGYDGALTYSPGNITATVTFAGLPQDYTGDANLSSYISDYTISALGQTIYPSSIEFNPRTMDFQFENGVITYSYIDAQNIPFTAGEADYFDVDSNYGSDGTLNYAIYEQVAGTPSLSGQQDDGGVWTIETTVPCYAAGTRITTARGERPVEHLAIGDLIATRRGRLAPVKWLGHRRIESRRHPNPADIWPVRVSTGAFDVATPHRDLYLSPDHAICVEDALIPVKYLINGTTIAQLPRDHVTYWHVELDHHDVILAEGLPCETYLDTGNRGAFANGGASVQMHPDFALRIWAANSCAPLVLTGPRLIAAKRRLLARASRLGHTTTDDPALRIVVDGRDVNVETDGRRWRAHLPAGARTIRLISRIWSPAQTRPDETDTRPLGVAIAHLRLDRRELRLDSPSLTAGWHDPEPAWRWTGGNAELSPDGAQELAFELAMTGTYWNHGKTNADLAAQTSHCPSQCPSQCPGYVAHP